MELRLETAVLACVGAADFVRESELLTKEDSSTGSSFPRIRYFGRARARSRRMRAIGPPRVATLRRLRLRGPYERHPATNSKRILKAKLSKDFSGFSNAVAGDSGRHRPRHPPRQSGPRLRERYGFRPAPLKKPGFCPPSSLTHA